MNSTTYVPTWAEAARGGRLSNESCHKEDPVFPHFFHSCLVTELLARAVVDECHRPLYVFLRYPLETPIPGKKLTKKPICLFIESAFPRTASMAKVACCPKMCIYLLVI